MTDKGPASLLGGRAHLIDNSVYARTMHPVVTPIWTDALQQNLLVSSPPFVLEAVVSARDAKEAGELLEELTQGLRYLSVDEETWRLAIRAQQTMAAVGAHHHRRPPADYLISALAHQHSLPVLHYDLDYEAISADSGLRFEHLWIAERGTLEEPNEQPQIVRALKKAIGARLSQFKGTDDEEALHREVIAQLDRAIKSAGKLALPPPPP
jgi:predicted nucleic acid-binding protein